MINWEKSVHIPVLTGNRQVLVVYGTNKLAETSAVHEILTPEELKYAERLRGEGQKSTWIACRTNLRLILSTCLDKTPKEIEFRKSRFGKPYLVHPDLCFNSSHSKSAFLLGFSFGGRIGIDIELLNGSEDLPSMVQYAFSESETEYCLQGKSPERFTEIWTLKEAFLKAVGIGLVNDLTAVSVAGTSSESIERFRLNQKSFRCPNGETGAVVYRNNQPLKFTWLV